MSSIFPFYTAKREPTAENQFGEILPNVYEAADDFEAIGLAQRDGFTVVDVEHGPNVSWIIVRGESSVSVGE